MPVFGVALACLAVAILGRMMFEGTPVAEDLFTVAAFVALLVVCLTVVGMVAGGVS